MSKQPNRSNRVLSEKEIQELIDNFSNDDDSDIEDSNSETDDYNGEDTGM